jgi:hypothetical protein
MSEDALKGTPRVSPRSLNASGNTVVAKFYFHLRDGEKSYNDPAGVDLLDAAAAEAFARLIASNLSADTNYDRFCVDVRDGHDNQIARISVLP